MKTLWWRYPRAVWIIALAFTSLLDPRRRGRRTAWWIYVLAVVLWPAFFLSMLPYALIGRIYTNLEGTVAVSLHRSGGAESVRLGISMTVTGVLYVTLIATFGLPALIYVLSASAVMIAPSARGQIAALNLMFSPPQKPYWTVEAIARIPGSSAPALQTVRDLLMRVVPVGELVTAVAGSQKLARVYERLGLRRISPDSLILSAFRVSDSHRLPRQIGGSRGENLIQYAVPRTMQYPDGHEGRIRASRRASGLSELPDRAHPDLDATGSPHGP